VLEESRSKSSKRFGTKKYPFVDPVGFDHEALMTACFNGHLGIVKLLIAD
jgi:hypothetical protein